MNFSTVEKVGAVVDAMVRVDLIRGTNRALVNDLFNGMPPYPIAQQDENKIEVNINWREACVLGHQARRQYEQAFLGPTNFFSVDIPRAPVMKRLEWSNFITKTINKTMKTNLGYIQLVRSKFAGIVLHGVGAQHWEGKYSWKPRFVAIEDLMVPTDTDEDFENLPYFAIRRIYTPGQLFRKISGRNVDPGWKKDAIYPLLNEMKETNTTQQAYDWMNNPEKMAELWKQNTAYYESDAAPSITLWDFYHLEEDAKRPGWRRKMVLDKNGVSMVANGFIYDGGKRVIADRISEILHVNFGDLSNKPPFKYHSVRSLGFLLFDVCHMMNRLRCRFTQRVFEDLLTWYRVNDPANKGRLNNVFLDNGAIISDGLSIVKRDERYQVDANLVETLMANFRQLMSESSSTFTQDIDSGTKKEETATGVMAKVNQVNALLTSLLSLAYVQENFSYMEICRRFCNPRSEDAQVKRFQILCQEKGIQKKYLNASAWDIVPETSLGSGNKIMQVAQAKAVMEVRPQLDPQAQKKATHLYLEAVTDAKFAEELAPLDGKNQVSDDTQAAEWSFTTMMTGIPMMPKEGTNHIEQIEVLLVLMTKEIQKITNRDNMGTPDQVIGLRTVAQNVAAQIKMLAQDETMQPRVKKYSEVLGQLMNLVKGFQQRQMQAMKKAAARNGNGNGQIDPETISKIQSDKITAEAKARATDLKTQQALQHKQLKFVQQQRQDAAKTNADIQRENVRTGADIRANTARTAQELHDNSLVAAHEAGMAPVEEPTAGEG